MPALDLFTKNLNPESATLLKQLSRVLSGGPGEAWLVGGCVRDLLSGRPANDFDFAFSQDLTPQVKAWARQVGGSWFWLDQKRLQSRVVFSKEGLQFDFSALRAADIGADLRLRDFSLNAIALSLNRPAVLIDPLGGRNDLQAGVLRSCGPTVLSDDPLRILKGVRHFAEHGWQIEAQTAAQMKQAAPLLARVAGERIKVELGRILVSERAVSALDLLRRHGVLADLFDNPAPNELAAHLDPVMARLEQLERYPELAALLNNSVEEGVRRKALLLFARLLKLLAAPPSVSRIVQRLRFSKSANAILKRLAKPDISLLDLFNPPKVSRIAALKVETLGPNGQEAILAALLSRQEANFDREAETYLSAFRHHERKGKIANLLDGKTLMRLTGLRAGSEVGLWQERIKAAEIAGEISDQSGAILWLKARFSD